MTDKKEKMTIGGKILKDVMDELVKAVTPGVSEIDLEEYANKLILEKGGKPGFKRVKGYNFATCISTNDEVVHGIPTERILKIGDIVGIDCGVYYGGYNTDMSETVIVEKVDKNTEDFLKTGKKALLEAIKEAKAGNRIGNISKTIQDIVEGKGYSVVRSLVGHGVGRDLHEQPEIPGYLNRDIKNTPLIKEGMTLAIEVIYNMGKPDIAYSETDNWTIISKDKSLSATFEKTVFVDKKGPIILT